MPGTRTMTRRSAFATANRLAELRGITRDGWPSYLDGSSKQPTSCSERGLAHGPVVSVLDVLRDASTLSDFVTVRGSPCSDVGQLGGPATVTPASRTR
jgi:hypothetical protein